MHTLRSKKLIKRHCFFPGQKQKPSHNNCKTGWYHNKIPKEGKKEDTTWAFPRDRGAPLYVARCNPRALLQRPRTQLKRLHTVQ